MALVAAVGTVGLGAQPAAALLQDLSYTVTTYSNGAAIGPGSRIIPGSDAYFEVKIKNLSTTNQAGVIGSAYVTFSDFTISFDNAEMTCSGGNPASLMPDESYICVSPTFVLTPTVSGASSVGISFTDPVGTVSRTSWTSVAINEISLTQSAPTLTTNRIDGAVELGDVVVFNMTVKNTGQAPVSSVAVTDDLGLSYVCAESDLAADTSTACTSDPYTATAADVSNGEILNSGHAEATTLLDRKILADSETRLISAFPITPTTGTNLVVTKTTSVSTAKPGDEVDYLIRVENASAFAATDVTISDVLPAQLTYQSSGSIITTFDAATRTVSIHIDHIGPGGVVRLPFTVRINSDVPAGSSIVNVGTTDQNHGCAVEAVDRCMATNTLHIADAPATTAPSTPATAPSTPTTAPSTPTTAPASAEPGLAKTGADTYPVVLLGLGMLTLGGMLVLAKRRKAASASK